MHEAQKSYLEKHIAIMNKDMKKILGKRDHLKEYVKYGVQNN